MEASVLSPSPETYAALASVLRVYNVKNVQMLRSSLYYNLSTILAALDIAAGEKP
jgi:hypothetical protein